MSSADRRTPVRGTPVRGTTVRQRPEPATASGAGSSGWLAAPRKAYRFLALSVRKAHTDDLRQKSAALAFITIVSLIPLLAAFSSFGARWFDQQQTRAVEILTSILPYSEEAIVTRLEGFLENAQKIRGVGIVMFFVAALAVFTTVEETVNRIWSVPRRRPFRGRLLSFTLVLFWGPLVIGATYSSLFFLRRQPAFQEGPLALPANFIPFTMTLLALTMLYWLVPHTTVRFRSALAGGLTAAILLELLRQGFGLFVDQAKNISIIYGGFGFALLFMISIQAAWWIVLLGSEAAYCLQNFELMSRRRHPAAPADGSWIALIALVLITRRFKSGEPITPHEVLAVRLQLETEELRKVLSPLLRNGVLRETEGESEGYLLATDPHDLTVARVFEIYEPLHRKLVEPLPDELRAGLGDLRARLDQVRARDMAAVTLIELIGTAKAVASD